MHYYQYLANDGVEFLRIYSNLPSEIVPATLKESIKPAGRPIGSPVDCPCGPLRFEGDKTLVTKKNTDETPSGVAPLDTSEIDANMQDPKKDALGVENGVPKSGDKFVHMETTTKVEALKKKKVKKANIPESELVCGARMLTGV